MKTPGLITILFMYMMISGCSMFSDKDNMETAENTESSSQEEPMSDAESQPEDTGDQSLGDAAAETDNEDSDSMNKGDKTTDTGMNGNVQAEYVCTNGDGKRIIRVIHITEDGSTRCEVTYEKMSGTKTLWNAQSDMSYCTTKAEEFVAKQGGWGWTCKS